jgi:hypothetical protein
VTDPAFEAAISETAIGAICAEWELPLPLMLRGADVLPADAEDRRRQIDAALTDLVERGLLVRTDGRLPPDAPLVGAIRSLGQPSVLVTAYRQSPTHLDSMFVSIVGPTAVEHRVDDVGLHRLATVEVADVLPRVSRFCALVERPAVAPGTARLAATELLELQARVDAGGVGAAAPLTVARSDEPVLTRLALALAARVSSVQVTVTQQTSANRVNGTSTGWIDGAEHGLWRVAVPAVSFPWDTEREDDGGLDSVQCVIATTTARSLLDEISEGFEAHLAMPAPVAGQGS